MSLLKVRTFLLLQTDGVYIEAGAYDGEEASNSLYFELLGWKGLLVECTPPSFVRLMAKNRKAWVSDVCLSTTQKPGKVSYILYAWQEANN
jgi:hypothetical protein